jgi:hypothetical protein
MTCEGNKYILSDFSICKSFMGSSSYKYIFIIVAVILALLLSWNFFLVPQRVDVSVTPAQLTPDGHSTSVVRLVLYNRVGFAIPFRHPMFTIEILQGRELARLEFSRDSTTAVFHAGFQSGTIEMNVHTKVTPFPLFATLHIAPQLALLSQIHC